MNGIDSDWFLRKGFMHAIRIPYPHIVVISDSMKTDLDLQAALDGCLYTEGVRALFFSRSGLYFCDVSQCAPESIEGENAKTMKKGKTFLESRGKKTTPESVLASLIEQAR